MTTSQQLNAALINALAAKVQANTATAEEVAIYTKGMQLLQAGTDFEAVTAGLADQSVTAINTAKDALVLSGNNSVEALGIAQAASVTAINTVKDAIASIVPGIDAKLTVLQVSLREAWGYSTGKAVIGNLTKYSANTAIPCSAVIPLYDKITDRLYSAIRTSFNASSSELTIRYSKGGTQTNLRMISGEIYTNDGFQCLLPLSNSATDPTVNITYITAYTRDGSSTFKYTKFYTLNEGNWAAQHNIVSSLYCDSGFTQRIKYDRVNKSIVYLAGDGTLPCLSGLVRELFADGSTRQVTGNHIAPAGFDTYTSDTTRFVLLPSYYNTNTDTYLWGYSASSSTNFNYGFYANDGLSHATDSTGSILAFCPQWVIDSDGSLLIYKTTFSPIIDTYTISQTVTGNARSYASVRGYKFAVLDHLGQAIRYGTVLNPSVQQVSTELTSAPGDQHVWKAALPYGYHLADDFLQSIYTKSQYYNAGWYNSMSMLDITRLTK